MYSDQVHLYTWSEYIFPFLHLYLSYIYKTKKKQQQPTELLFCKYKIVTSQKYKMQRTKMQRTKMQRTKMQRTKQQKTKIHNEGNINRASAKEQGLLLAGSTGCFSGGDLDQDQVTTFGFFCRQQNISMSLMWLDVFFWGGRCCTVSSKQSSRRNAALGLCKTHCHRSKDVLCSLSEVSGEF